MSSPFPEFITLTKDEALDVLAELETVAAELTERGEVDLSFAVHEVSLVIMQRLADDGDFPPG
ncbi:MAG: hypothetical protein ACR2G7_07795 [Acidimicrobiales bacterium]